MSLNVERLATAMLAMRGNQTVDELRARAAQLIRDTMANPLNPHGSNEDAIVEDLIESIDVLKTEEWRQIRRVLIRGSIKGA